jgi:multiple sugar transport system permease protein
VLNIRIVNNLKSSIKYLSLSLYAITCLYPFVWMLCTSLKTSSNALMHPTSMIPDGLHFETYATVWTNLNIMRNFFNSVFFSLTVVVLVIILYSMIGFALARINFFGKTFIFYLFISLMLVPGMVVLIPLYINMNQLGLVNNFFGLVLPVVNGGGAFAVFLYTNYFKSISQELYESAEIDGASAFRIYAQIYFPIALPVAGTIGIMNFIGTWNSILWPMIILNDPIKFTLPMAIMYLNTSRFTQWNLLMAGAVISVIPVIIVFVFMQKFYIQGLAAGAVKG